jgi:hypothetical protein
MAIKINRRMKGAASGKYLNNRRASLRNVTGGPNVTDPSPGNSPPIIPGKPGQGEPPSQPDRPRGPNAQGYSPIRYGAKGLKWGYAKVGQARNQGAPPPPGGGGGNPWDTGWGQGNNGGQGNGDGGQGNGQGNGDGQGQGQGNGTGLPTLSPRLRAFLEQYGGNDYDMNNASAWWAHGDEFGGGVPVDAVRRFLRQGKAAGLSNKELLALTNKNFLKGVSDPGTRANGEMSTGAGLLKFIGNNYTPEQWQSLSGFAGGMTPNYAGDAYGGADPGNGMASQAALLDQFPDLWNKYARMAGLDQGTIDRFNYEHGLPTSEGYVPPLPADDDQAVRPGGGNAFANSATAASQAPYSNSGAQVGAGQSSGPTGGQGQPGQTIGMTGTGNQVADAASQAQAQQAAAQTQMQLNSLPLDPQFEGQRRVLQAQLDRQLSQINASYGRLGAEQNLAQSRLDTNRGVDEQRLLESMAGRGTLNSSIYGDNRESLATDYGRMQTDLGISIADALAGLSGQQGDAYSNYDQGLIELLSQSASNFMQDPLSAGVSQQGYTMGGGNGGKWKSSWKPKWKPPKQRGN